MRHPFNERLRQLMKKKGVTQAEMASLFGISRQSLSLYCNGKTQPNIETIVKMAEYFGVSVDYLFGLAEERIKVAINLPDDVVKRILSDENFRLAITNLAKYL